MEKIITLSQYAKEHGVKYRAAWNRFKAGKIPTAYKDEHGTILVKKIINADNTNKAIIYTRVSSNENKSNLDSQADRISSFAIARGYQIIDIVKEVGSGLNDSRKKLTSILKRDDYGILIVENKDILTRFGFNYLETLLNTKGVKIEVVNLAQDCKSDLIQDFISIIYSFSTRLYGLRRAKSKSNEIKKCLELTD